jgi:hypothetical protein
MNRIKVHRLFAHPTLLNHRGNLTSVEIGKYVASAVGKNLLGLLLGNEATG